MPNPFGKIASSLTESFRREVGGDKAGAREVGLSLTNIKQAFPDQPEGFFKTAVAIHEGGHFFSAVENAFTIGGHRIYWEGDNPGGAVLSTPPSDLSSEAKEYGRRMSTVSGSAALNIALKMNEPTRLSGDFGDIYQHAKIFDPSLQREDIGESHVNRFYEDVQARMGMLQPYRENILAMGKAIHENPVWNGVGGDYTEKWGAPESPMPYSVYKQATEWAHITNSGWNNRGMFIPQDMEENAFGSSMATPYNAWSASHIGNAIQSFRGLVANELNTSNAASRLAKQIGGGMVNNNPAWDIIAQQTGQRFLNISGPNENPEYGKAGGLQFGFRRPNITTNAQGEMTAWQVHTYSGANDTGQANLSAHLHAILSGATHYGVASVNRDAYQAAISAGMSPQQALAQSNVISAGAPQPVNPRDPALAAEYAKLSAIQDYSQMANNLSGANIGMRIDPSSPQALQLQHVDEQLKALSGAISDPSIEQTLFGMQIGQGVADPSVANALFLKTQGGAATAANVPTQVNTPVTPTSVAQATGSGGIININNPPGSYPSMSATSGGIRIPTQQPYGSSPIPGNGMNIPDGNYPSSPVGSGNMGGGFLNVSPAWTIGGGMSGGGGGVGSPSGMGGGNPLPFDTSQYHPQLAALSNALAGLSKISEDAAKSTMHLTDTQSGYIAQASKLSDTLGKGLQQALPAALSGNADAMDFLQKAGGGTGQLQNMLGGMGGLRARSMADSFGAYNPSQVPSTEDVFATFLMGGKAGRKARSTAEQEGWYGTSEGEIAESKILGTALAAPSRLLGAHFRLRALGEDVLGPMTQSRDTYLQSQQALYGQMAQSDVFGGANVVNTSAYQNLLAPQVAMRNQQLALGAESNAVMGGISTLGASVMGGRNAAQAQSFATMVGAGAMAGGIAMEGNPYAIAGGAALGGAAFLGGEYASVQGDQARRTSVMLNGMTGGVGSSLRSDFMGTISTGLGYALGSSTASSDGDMAVRIRLSQNNIFAQQMPGAKKAPTDFGYESQFAGNAFNAGSQQGNTFDGQGAFYGLDDGVSKDQKEQLAAQVQSIMGGADAVYKNKAKAREIFSALKTGQLAGVDLLGQAMGQNAMRGGSGASADANGVADLVVSGGKLLTSDGGSGITRTAQAMQPMLSGMASSLKAAGFDNIGVDTPYIAKQMYAAQQSGNVAGQRQLTQGLQITQSYADNVGNGSMFSEVGLARQRGMAGVLREFTATDNTAKYRQGMNNLGTYAAGVDTLSYGYGMGDSAADNATAEMYRQAPISMSANQQVQAMMFGRRAGLNNVGDQISAGQWLASGRNVGGIEAFGQYGLNTSSLVNQGNAIMGANNVQGFNYSNNLAQLGGMAAGAAGLTGASPSSAQMSQYAQIAATPNQASAQFGMNVLAGNPIASSIYAQANPNQAAIWQNVVQTTGDYRGMPTMYSQVNAQQAAARQSFGASQGYIQSGEGAYSSSQLAGMSTLELDKAQYTQQINLRNFDFGQQQRSLNRQQAQTQGDWGYEDRGIGLSRQQQDYSYGIQGKQIALQGQQMGYEYAHQTQEMQIGFQHQQTQSGWQLQNLQYQQNVSDLQYGFGQIDADEAVRYSTGRQRRDAMRHRDESTIMHSVESGQNTVEQDRVKQQQKWAQDQFDRDKSYAAQEETFKKQNFALTEEEYKKTREFTLEQRRLDDEKRNFDRQIAREDMADAQLNLRVHQEATKTMDNLAAAQRVANDLTSQWNANLQFAGQTMDYTSQQIQNLTTYIQGLGGAAAGVSGGGGIDGGGVGGGGTTGGGGGGGGTLSMASGGFTGYGPKMQYAGSVHKGEWIIPQEGSPVVQSPEHINTLNNIHSVMKEVVSVLKQIQQGGNAIVNINQTNSGLARHQALSLLDKTYG